jgi:transposase
MRVAVQVVLSAKEREDLERLAVGRKVPARVVERAGIVLLAAEGKQNREIAKILGVERRTVSLWRRRFVEKRIPGILKDAPRPGRRPRISAEVIADIIRKTTQETPAGRTHWSTRSLGKVMGLSPSTIGRVWRRHGLKPHLSRTFNSTLSDQLLGKGAFCLPPGRGWGYPGLVDSLWVGRWAPSFGGPGGQSPPVPRSYGNASRAALDVHLRQPP